MNSDIILSGVGGQGILSIAAVIDLAAIKEGLNIKQAEVHGMSQRGGAVQSHLRISPNKIYSDLIPKGSADIILSVEPLEALRYLDYLKEGGFVISSTNEYKNINNYPSPEELLGLFKNLKNKILIDAEKLAKQAGNLRTNNMVMLGAASTKINISIDSLKFGINKLFSKKGNDIINANINALLLGREYANKQKEHNTELAL